MNNATTTDVAAIARNAINDTTRTIAAEGVRLTWEQAEELGEAAIAWACSRLGLVSTTDDSGVTLAPRA